MIDMLYKQETLEKHRSGPFALAFAAVLLVQILMYASPAYGQNGSGSSQLKGLYAGKFGLRARNELECDTIIVTQLIPTIVQTLPNGFMRDAFKRDSSVDLATSQAGSYALLRDAALEHPIDIANAQVAYSTVTLLFAEKGYYLDEEHTPIPLAKTRIISLDTFKEALQDMGFDISSFAYLTHEKIYVLDTPRFSFQGHTQNGVIFVNDDQERFLKQNFNFQDGLDVTANNELFHSAAELGYIDFDLQEPVGQDSVLLSGLAYMDAEEFGSVVTSMLVSDNVQQTFAEFLFLRIVNGDFVPPTDIEGDAGYYGSTLLLKEICTTLGLRSDIEKLQTSRSAQHTITSDKTLMANVQGLMLKVDKSSIKGSFLDMRRRVAKIYTY